jgi:hypothetical protein
VGSIIAKGERRGQAGLPMAEPQQELLGEAEQPPAVSTKKPPFGGFFFHTYKKVFFVNIALFLGLHYAIFGA